MNESNSDLIQATMRSIKEAPIAAAMIVTLAATTKTSGLDLQTTIMRCGKGAAMTRTWCVVEVTVVTMIVQVAHESDV